MKRVGVLFYLVAFIASNLYSFGAGTIIYEMRKRVSPYREYFKSGYESGVDQCGDRMKHIEVEHQKFKTAMAATAQLWAMNCEELQESYEILRSEARR